MRGMYHALVVVLAVAPAWSSFAQALIDPLHFYPLHTGDLWQYSYTNLNLWPDSVIVTVRVTGDTTMTNGRTYKVIRSTDTFGRLSAPHLLAVKGTYQRVDTTVATVYRYCGDGTCGRGDEEAALWLAIPAWNEPHPDTSVQSDYVFRFDSLRTAEVLGKERPTLYGRYHFSPESEERNVRLSSGLGTVWDDRFGGAPLWMERTRLLYARVAGEESGKRVTTTAEQEAALPGAIILEVSYPNPFFHAVAIPFQLNARETVHLAVYDLLGREVVVLVNEALDPGTHSVEWRPKEGAAGVYLCELRAGSTRRTQLLIRAQ